jgi:hypothetical protein
VLARRCGEPNIHYMTARELADAENSFMNRVELYFDQLQNAIHETA